MGVNNNATTGRIINSGVLVQESQTKLRGRSRPMVNAMATGTSCANKLTEPNNNKEKFSFAAAENDRVILSVNPTEDEFIDSEDETTMPTQESPLLSEGENTQVQEISHVTDPGSTDKWFGMTREDLKARMKADPELSSLIHELSDKRVQPNWPAPPPVATNTPIKRRSRGNIGGNMVKSPSDTTLYTPALQQIRQNNAVEQISNFVQEIQLAGLGNIRD